MRVLYTCLLFLLLSPSIAFSQQNFQPGYVITLKGDTLNGFIDYREWNINPAKITFKTGINSGSTQIYSPNNALGFGLEKNENYQRLTVSISQGAGTITSDNQKADTTTKTEQVFLKSLIKGNNVNLLSYTDRIKIRYYTYTANGAPVELDHHLFFNDGENTLSNSTRYRVQLNYLAQGLNMFTPEVAAKIAQAQYIERDLTKVIRLLNTKAEQQQLNDDKSGAVAFVGAGLTYNTIDLKGHYFDNSALQSNNILPFLAGGFDYFLNKQTKTTFLRVEALLGAEHYTFSQITGTTINGATVTNNLDLKVYTATINLQIGYNFYNTKALKVFASTGIGVKINKYNDYKFITTYGDNTPAKSVDKYPVFFSSRFVIPVVNAGVQLHEKITIFGGFIPIPSQSDYFNVTTTQLGMYYSFK